MLKLKLKFDFIIIFSKLKGDLIVENKVKLILIYFLNRFQIQNNFTIKSKNNKPEVQVASQRPSFRSFLYVCMYICMMFSTISVHAQLEYPPDYLDDSPKMFYENKGQIIDDMDNITSSLIQIH